MASSIKKTVAVMFGGRSPEHDVSVVTGLQVLHAIDRARYDAFPVYITTDGTWLTGDPLANRATYIPDTAARKTLTEVTLDATATGRGVLLPRKPKLFGGAKPKSFDVAIPAFHGLFGEDGALQGLFETANVPYVGARGMASSVLMDKVATKRILASIGVPALPYAVVPRPAQGLMIPADTLRGLMATIGFPCIVKPCNLGSSIGVGKATNIEEVAALLPAVFRHDTAALIEPFVQNLVEYNVAVCGAFGDVRTSAIERPKSSSELLDFKQKYLSGGGKGGKTGAKQPGSASQGMLSLTREINPTLPADLEQKIRQWSAALFTAVNGAGAPRIDFLCNGQTGELWLNEANPFPGSLGYFLWEAAEKPVLFTQLLNLLIDEAFALHARIQLPADPVPMDARLLLRRV